MQYLDKIEVTTIKALKNNLSKDPIKEIKSIFGIYEIILLGNSALPQRLLMI